MDLTALLPRFLKGHPKTLDVTQEPEYQQAVRDFEELCKGDEVLMQLAEGLRMHTRGTGVYHRFCRIALAERASYGTTAELLASIKGNALRFEDQAKRKDPRYQAQLRLAYQSDFEVIGATEDGRMGPCAVRVVHAVGL